MNSNNYDLGTICMEHRFPSTICLRNSVSCSGSEYYAMKSIMQVLKFSTNFTLQTNFELNCQIVFTRIDSIENMYPRILNVVELDAWTFGMENPEKIIGIVKYFRPFQKKVWILIFSVILIIYLFWLASDFILYGRGRLTYFIEILAILFNQSVSLDTLRTTFTHKIFLNYFVICDLLLSSAYLGLLYSYMLVPEYEQKLHSKKDLENFGDKIPIVLPLYHRLLEVGYDDTRLNKLVKILTGSEIRASKLVLTTSSVYNFLQKSEHYNKYILKKNLIPVVMVYGVARKIFS